MVKMIEGRAAIVVIDVQYDFLPGGAVPAVDGCEIVPRINRLIEAGRKAGIPVIFTQEFHRKDKVDFGRELDGAEAYHCLEGTQGVEIVKDLKVAANDYVIKKPRYDIFLGTGMEYLLNGLGIKPGDTLILVGLVTNVCVHYSTASAHQRDYRVRVIEECCAGTSVEEHNASMTAMEYLQAGARVKLEDVLGAIAKYKT
ncbi:MAG: cysteine hydrolase [Chloroflexi bacterium]|nr:cysteine hydrolase [Chloroflexota bacterium]